MKSNYLKRKELFLIILSFYKQIIEEKEFRKEEIKFKYDINDAIFKIMLQAIREMLELEYGYPKICYIKNTNKYVLII